MTQYFFILADSELELVPQEIVNERCVLNNARARGKMPEKILPDASHHHPAFGKLPDSEQLKIIIQITILIDKTTKG